jgi:exonuclease SbcC
MMLDKLQSNGRKIGVISHLTGMLDQIPVKVNVVRLSPGRSKVEITGNKH